ncbi:hypothetical protein P22_0326 [Propionispora sp. 2/2-37]|uniref:hypothetical protein n=1 Tax=Propionispora sp. 2/2-37 TaxID=1677858 RepID=UPI0006BB5E94|nr:hypothetical protein [Propionispora sp. 2/2-37]CUH94260.1 hypothetical protein P22_0326 [Propionispora sp. 2/2-37]
MHYTVNGLSEKDVMYLQEAMELENLCITKCAVYADQCQDPNIKNLFSHIAKTKRQHADKIKLVLEKKQI